MPELAIDLLGEPHVRLPEGGEEAGRFDRTRLLLYYLAAHPGAPCRRERLADLFWPEADVDAARLNLRQTLHKLRRLLGPAAGVLEVDRTTVTLRPGPRCRVDVAELEGAEDPAVLARWRGPFLAGYPDGRGLEGYDAWVARRRSTLAEAARQLLEAGVRARRQGGDIPGALALARQHEGILPGGRPAWLEELEATARRAPPRPNAGEGAELERRPVTVVHLDPFGDGGELPSAGLAGAMAPLEALLQRHGGHVVAFPGGGLVAWFGYPAASEHASRQALRAARAAVVDSRLGGLRAGVAGGVTLVAAQGGQPDVAGDVAGAAFDLAQEAPPGEVHVAPELADALEGPFRFEPGGTAPRLTGEAGRSGRLEAAARRAAGRPLLEREEALARLTDAWERVRAGEGQVVAVRGEAGLGKTRLLLALRARIQEEAGLVRELVCDPLDRQQPLGPALDLLRRLLPAYGGGVPDLLRTWGVRADPATVSALHRLVDGDGVGLEPGGPREAILELLADVTAAAADHYPSAWLIDDLQWMDDTSRDLLDRLLSRSRGRRLLMVLSGRPEAPFPEAVTTTVELAPLTVEGARALVRSGPALPAAAEERVLSLAEGNPLYLEELTRQAAEGGDGLPEGSPEGIPERIRDRLAAVVDGYADQRGLASLAAVAGHAFPGELVVAAAGG
ncbi:MAG: AAA family ATPase, partial [Thiohalospira sp.]